jgi:ketosteroid isomerase-like protein
MKRIAPILLFVFATSLIPGFSRAADESSKSAEEAIQKLEREWADALLKADQAVIDRIEASDWTLTDPEGKLVTKAKADADLKSGTVKFESINLDELKVRVYSDTAIVNGLETEKSKYQGKDTSGQYCFTDVFIKRGGHWKAIGTHISRVVQK